MKKIIPFSLLLVFLILNKSLAQEVYLIAGTNLSTLDLSNNDQDFIKSRIKQPGFQIGAAYELNIGNDFSFFPQAQFSLKREKTFTEIVFSINNPEDSNYNSTVFKQEIQYNEYYLDIPLSFKYSFPIKEFNLNIIAGPYFNLLLFDNNKTNSNGEEATEFKITEKFINRLDYGFNIGIGVNYKSIILNLSSAFGIYREMKYEELIIDNKVKNNILKLSVGYKL